MTEKRINELKSENRLLREQIKGVQNRFEDKIAELSMIREIGMALLHIYSFERACEIILDVIINNTVVQNFSIMLMDHEKDQLFLVAATDPAKKTYIVNASEVFSKEGVRYTFKPGEGAAGQALLERRPVLIRDTQESSYFATDIKSQTKIGSLLSVPLVIEDEPIGVLNLSHPDRDIFETSYVNLFNIISNFVALSIHSTLNYEKLQHSEAKYRALSENSNDGIAIIQDRTHVYANPTYQEFTGYSLEDLKKIPLESLLDISNTNIDFRHIRSFLNGKSGHKQFEVQLCGRKEKVDVEINSSTIQYNGKNALIVSVWDLTQRKKLERQLRHAQKMEDIGTIASGVTHNFRNILAGISVNSQLLRRKYQDDQQFMAIAEKTDNAVKMGVRLIDGLMQFSHKQGTKRFEILNLSQVIHEVHDLIRESFDKKIKIRIDLPESLPIMGDHSGLSHVIMNLCVNARDAMPDGGKLRITAAQKKGMAESIISDTGHGMDKEALAKCFDPFFTTKDVGKGTGLGLSTSYRIIKEHEGDIQAYSKTGEGTTFKISLPIASVKDVSRDDIIPDLIGGRGQKILIVDDDTDMLKPIEDLLESMNYRAASVSRGQDAIAKYTSWQPDAVLMDRNMPEMDGIACTRKIIKQDPDARVILISGYDESGPDGIDLRSRRLISGYITKPIDMVELSQVLAGLFGQ